MKFKKLREKLDRIPTRLTKAGWWYVGATALTSAAAYHSASNVLFLALAFQMSALLLNGLISWWNFSKLETRLLRVRKVRAGQSGNLQFELVDHKKVMRSQGLRAVIEVKSPQGWSTERLKRFLQNRYHPSGRNLQTVQWTPTQRGWHTVKVTQIESYFPFGLLLKVFRQELSVEALVWPAHHQSGTSIDTPYDASSHSRSDPAFQSASFNTLELNSDISGLKNYTRGDPVHSFHWKKTAQFRRPIVMELKNIVSQNPELVRFDFHESHFDKEQDIHAFCSAIATWVESKIRGGTWVRLALHDHAELLVHNETSFARMMDQLAVIQAQQTVLEFKPNPGGQSTIKPRDICMAERRLS